MVHLLMIKSVKDLMSMKFVAYLLEALGQFHRQKNPF